MKPDPDAIILPDPGPHVTFGDSESDRHASDADLRHYLTYSFISVQRKNPDDFLHIKTGNGFKLSFILRIC
jgi:hypothetical protein